MITIKRVNETVFAVRQESFIFVKSEFADNDNKTTQEIPIPTSNMTTVNNYTLPRSNHTKVNNTSNYPADNNTLWTIPLTFVTDTNSSKALTWFREKGKHLANEYIMSI